MPTGVRELRIYQAGREVAYGTPVAATNRLVGQLEVTADEVVVMPAPQIGILLENPTTDQTVRRMATAKFSGELTYEQILYLLEASVKGGVSPTGAGADRTWLYTSAYAADPVLKSFSLQRRLTDGTTNWDEGIAYALLKDAKISGAIGELVKFDSTWFGRPIDPAVALTAAIPVPSVNFASAADVKVYLDTTFANLGTTQLLGDVVSWDFNWKGIYQPKLYQDGRADRSFSSHALQSQGYDASIQVEWNAQINGFRTQAASRALLYCRIVATGPTLGASNYKVQIDFVCRFKAPQFDQAGDRDGNDTAVLELVSAYDPAQSLGLKFTVVNALTAWL